MRRVEYMIGPHDFTTLKAEQFMQNVVSYYHVEDTGDKLAGAITEGGFGSVPILASDGKVVGLVSEFDLLKAITEGKQLKTVTAGDIMHQGDHLCDPRYASDGDHSAVAEQTSHPGCRG